MEHFTDESVNEPAAQELLRKGRLVPDEEGQREWLEAVERGEDYVPMKVRVKTKDGRELEKVEGWARGTAMNPFSKEELYAKYRDCARYGGLPEENIERSLELLGRFEELKNIDELMDAIHCERW
jgi:2-methylcitrate dehydratase PrpD